MMFKHLHIGILSVFFFFLQNQKSFTGHAVGDISIACVCVCVWLAGLSFQSRWAAV